jgi:hypothetical protein
MVATYAWLCGGEFPSQRLRSYTFGLAASIGFLGAWLATFTAPYFINPDSLNWGPKYGYIWFPSCLLGALWTWLYLPEVQNRTFEEIDEMVSHTYSSSKRFLTDLSSLSSRLAFLLASSASTSVLDQLPLWPWRQRRVAVKEVTRTRGASVTGRSFSATRRPRWKLPLPSVETCNPST